MTGSQTTRNRHTLAREFVIDPTGRRKPNRADGWSGRLTRSAARLLASIVVTVALAPSVFAVDLELEARAIDAMLVAPCCFSQQVSVHQSATADEIRRDVRERLAAGEARQQILDAYVRRYGKRILAEPPAAGFDLALYVGPFVMLVASLWLVTVVVRRLTQLHPAQLEESPDLAASATANADAEARVDEELRDLD